MLAFIVLYLPAVLFVWLYEKLSGENISLKKWVYLYALGNLCTNALCWLTMRFAFGTAHDVFYSIYEGMLPVNACNYLLMAIPFALVLGALSALLGKKTSVSIEESGNEKK